MSLKKEKRKEFYMNSSNLSIEEIRAAVFKCRKNVNAQPFYNKNSCEFGYFGLFLDYNEELEDLLTRDDIENENWVRLPDYNELVQELGLSTFTDYYGYEVTYLNVYTNEFELFFKNWAEKNRISLTNEEI
jgi:hypothetical protein